MRLFLLLTVLIAACAPAEHDLTPREAGPQAGAVALDAESLDVGVNEEELSGAAAACTEAQYCSGLKTIVKAQLNFSCGGGWSGLQGACTAPGWTATASGGRSAVASRISMRQRYVSATQCTPFTVTCECSSDGTVKGCRKN